MSIDLGPIRNGVTLRQAMKSQVGRVFFLSSIFSHSVNTKIFLVKTHDNVSLTLESEKEVKKEEKVSEPKSPAGKTGDYSVGLNFDTDTDDAFPSYEEAKGKEDNDTECQNNSYGISKVTL